jgi:uncharacterized protein (TIGR02246 family)
MVKYPAGVAELIQALARAWTQGDSIQFAGLFTEDGDLVTIHGMRLRGRGAIAGLYDMLFRSVFRRSSIGGEVRACRRLCENTLLLQMHVTLHLPLGNMAGDHHAVCTLALLRDGANWQVASLHNTLVADGMERRLVA